MSLIHNTFRTHLMKMDCITERECGAIIRTEQQRLRRSHAHRWQIRTDALAAHLGISRNELQRRLGISKEMYYGYRSGKYPITAKAWSKLQAAETAVVHPPKSPPKSIPPYLLSMGLCLVFAALGAHAVAHLATARHTEGALWILAFGLIMCAGTIIFGAQTLFFARGHQIPLK